MLQMGCDGDRWGMMRSDKEGAGCRRRAAGYGLPGVRRYWRIWCVSVAGMQRRHVGLARETWA